jgi:hypothetical protein
MTSIRRASRVTRIARTALALLLSVRAGLGQAAAEELVGPSALDDPAPRPGPPTLDDATADTAEEEIVVYGRSLLGLRLEAYRAEDRFLSAFNELNSSDEFDIHCFNEAPTGSRIERRVCRANFAGDLTSAAAFAWMEDRPPLPSEAMMHHKSRQLREEMQRLVTENPELRQVLVEFVDAQRRFDDARKQYCSGRWLFCRAPSSPSSEPVASDAD